MLSNLWEQTSNNWGLAIYTVCFFVILFLMAHAAYNALPETIRRKMEEERKRKEAEV